MTKKNSTSKFYPIEEDHNKLPSNIKEKILNGVRIFGEIVTKKYEVEALIQIFANFKKDLEETGYFFLPQFETKNFIQGLIYRPATGSVIDKLYNREFYVNHYDKLFGGAQDPNESSIKGLDPGLVSVGDVLFDLRTNTIVNWDARHRTVALISASKEGAIPDNQWSNCVIIKKDAAKSIRPEKVACVYFKQKNSSPKKLSGEELFVSKVRADDVVDHRALTALQGAALRINTDKLPELDEGNPLTMSKVALFASQWDMKILGRGRHLARVVRSIKKAKWPAEETKVVSVYLILGYCYLLQQDEIYNGDFGFDNDIMIEALKWGYTNLVAKPSYYITPRANGKNYESVAYHLGRMYNRYVESDGYQGDRFKDLLDLNEYLPMPNTFLTQIGEETVGSVDESAEIPGEELDDEFDL